MKVSAFISSPHNQGFDPPAPSAQNGNELADEVKVWLKERVIVCVLEGRAQRPLRCGGTFGLFVVSLLLSFLSIIVLKCLQLLSVWMKASCIPDSSRGSQHQERTFTHSASILMQQPAAKKEFLIMLQGILLIPAEELQQKY